MNENKGWRSVADLVDGEPGAKVALVGAPLGMCSLTPGRCDLAPDALRRVLPRFSVYDLETGVDLSDLRVEDAGDVPLKLVTPEDALEPICEAVSAQLRWRELVVIAGGNNAVTRPGVRALADAAGELERVGLLTLDAHFDLRDTEGGLNNGNPVSALLEDGLPGRNVVQIGLAPFANTRKAHERALAAGITVHTARDCRERGTAALVADALAELSARCEAIYVDFDIDVIDRGQFPAAPGARPGGIPVQDFFDAARVVGAHPKVRAVDLTEYDPSLEVGDLGSLTAGRWFCELLAGFSAR
jgi:formiminoglutamase